MKTSCSLPVIDERSLFLGMENAQISGLPVSGNVFEELVTDTRPCNRAIWNRPGIFPTAKAA